MKTILKPSILTVTAILLTAVLSFNAVPDCPPVNPLDHTLLLPNPDDPCSFYSCDNGVAILMECPDGLCFNPALDVCDFPENIGGDGPCVSTTPGGKTKRMDGFQCLRSGCYNYFSQFCIGDGNGCTNIYCNY